MRRNVKNLSCVFAYLFFCFGCVHGTQILTDESLTDSGTAKPQIDGLPFDRLRHEIYEKEELLSGSDSDLAKNTSYDWKLFRYFSGTSKYNPTLHELRAQRSHDAGIDAAVARHFALDSFGNPTNQKVVVILGSHSKYRNDPAYAQIARLGFALTRAGFYVVSGGGPGLMEATHLGAYMSAYTINDLEAAIALLATSSTPFLGSKLKQYELSDYWSKSREVVALFPKGAESLGIPTWFYGHEGANAFSIKVAKYFSNALREEKICSIGTWGAIFADGGPGTQQEAFMDAAQNAYVSYNTYSPMIFFSDKPEAKEMASLMNKVTSSAYKNLDMVTVTSDIETAVSFLKAHPPVSK